jgi:CRP-like cAMP-binding protein
MTEERTVLSERTVEIKPTKVITLALALRLNCEPSPPHLILQLSKRGAVALCWQHSATAPRNGCWQRGPACLLSRAFPCFLLRVPSPLSAFRSPLALLTFVHLLSHQAERERAKKEAASRWWRLDDLDPLGVEKETSGVNDHEDEAAEEKTPCLIFHPHSTFRLVWDVLVLLFLIYFVFSVPYEMCFIATQFEKRLEDCQQASRTMLVDPVTGEAFCFPVKGCKDVLNLETEMCDYVLLDTNWSLVIFRTAIDCFFLMDILINFRTAYYVSAGDKSESGQTARRLETGALSLFRRYFFGWFIIDLLGSLPLDLLIAISAQQESSEQGDLSSYATLSKSVRFLKIFRLLKLVRAARLGRLIQKLQDSMSIRPGTLQLGILAFQFMTMAHMVACVLFLSGIQSEQYNCNLISRHVDRSRVLCTDEEIESGHKVSWLSESRIFSKNIGRTAIVDAPTDSQYLMSFYWAVTTMTTVGYGDLNPKTDNEVIACIFSMILGTYIFSYVVGNISDLIGQLGGDEAIYREKMQAVTIFMHDHHVAKDLKLRVRKYYDYALTNPSVDLSTPELAELSLVVKRDLLKFFRKNVLASSILFHSAVGEKEQRIMLALLEDLKNLQYGPGDYVYFEGEVGRALFFVFSGELDIVDPNEREVIATIKKGSFIGEDALLEDQERRTFSVRSRGWSHTLSLSVESLDYHMRDSPVLASNVRITARVRFGRLETAINSHKVLRRARHRGPVNGKKLLRVIARYGEQELGAKAATGKLKPGKAQRNSEVSALSGESGAESVERDTVTGEKIKKTQGAAMSRDEVEMLGDLRTAVFMNQPGLDLARLVAQKGIERWDWSHHWVDGLDIKEQSDRLAEEYGGAVVAERHNNVGHDALDALRRQQPTTGTSQNSEDGLSGPKLEKILRRIVFRLDAIDDTLESHHLLKAMRDVRKSVVACEEQVRINGLGIPTSNAKHLHTDSHSLMIASDDEDDPTTEDVADSGETHPLRTYGSHIAAQAAGNTQGANSPTNFLTLKSEAQADKKQTLLPLEPVPELLLEPRAAPLPEPDGQG